MSEPVRTCVACRTARTQPQLVRVVRGASGDIWVDAGVSRRPAGRGAYVCPDPDCIERAIATGGLKRALRLSALPEALRRELHERARGARPERPDGVEEQ